jgi:type VI protein secretion system component VasK
MKIKLPPGLFVKIAFLCAAIWLVVSLSEIPDYDTSATGKLDLLALSILVAVVIMAIGFVLQWVHDYYLATKRGRRYDD